MQCDEWKARLLWGGWMRGSVGWRCVNDSRDEERRQKGWDERRQSWLCTERFGSEEARRVMGRCIMLAKGCKQGSAVW